MANYIDAGGGAVHAISLSQIVLVVFVLLHTPKPKLVQPLATCQFYILILRVTFTVLVSGMNEMYSG